MGFKQSITASWIPAPTSVWMRSVAQVTANHHVMKTGLSHVQCFMCKNADSFLSFLFPADSHWVLRRGGCGCCHAWWVRISTFHTHCNIEEETGWLEAPTSKVNKRHQRTRRRSFISVFLGVEFKACICVTFDSALQNWRDPWQSLRSRWCVGKLCRHSCTSTKAKLSTETWRQETSSSHWTVMLSWVS